MIKKQNITRECRIINIFLTLVKHMCNERKSMVLVLGEKISCATPSIP